MSIKRAISDRFNKILSSGKSILLLGPRQAGKTTILRDLSPQLYLNLILPNERQRYESDPMILHREVKALEDGKTTPLIIVDEVQKVPELLNVAQDLIDQKKAQFVFSGSSARKLRRMEEINLIPGRIITLRLDPLLFSEISTSSDLKIDLESLLLFGTLPEVLLMEDPDLKELLLGSYVSSYLEEEVRQEGIVRKLGTFIRFLELAAAESGKVINYSNISQDLNVATQTVIGYFEILVDCLVAERITPYLEKDTRKRFIKAPKFLFFDTGVRRIAAKEGTKPTKESFGAMFEQFVGLELLRNMRLKSPRASLQFWRSHDGPEVDWLVPVNDSIIPVEVKWSDNPHPHDAKHVSFFLENFKTAELGYVVCRAPRRQKLADNVIAIPWQEIETITA